MKKNICTIFSELLIPVLQSEAFQVIAVRHTVQGMVALNSLHGSGRVANCHFDEEFFWKGLRGVSSRRHAPRRVHGCPEPYMVQDKFEILISTKNFSGKASGAFRAGV